jgi:hypothetical protein
MSRGVVLVTLDGERVLAVWLPVMDAPQFWDYRKREREARKLKAEGKSSSPQTAGRVSVSSSGKIHTPACRYFDRTKSVDRNRAAAMGGRSLCKLCGKGEGK